MTREENEMSEEQYMAQFRPDPALDDEGYYPGEKLWLQSHPDKQVDIPRMIQKLGNGTTEQTASGIPE